MNMRYVVLIMAILGFSIPAIARHHHTGAKGNLASWVDSIITQDSRGWYFFRYDYGSVNDVSTERRSQNEYVVNAHYTYNSGQRGWAKIVVINNRFNCIEFWNEGVCRGLREPLSDGNGGGTYTPSVPNDPFGGKCAWWQNEGAFGQCH